MAEQWTMIDASVWDLAGEETQGRRRHRWLRHASRTRTWLFKETVVEPDRHLHEDLTEKIASEFGHYFGIPAANVELAQRDGLRGCLVEDLRWSGGSHQAGQVLLAGLVEGYDPQHKQHHGHSVGNIKRALNGYAGPPQSPTPEHFDAFDVFVGYLVFDALIANSDRHDRNWAVLVRPPGESGSNALCGSYDHASSLGFNLSDDMRARRLSDGTVESWARRGKARQFERMEGQPVQSLVDLALSGLQACSPDVIEYWLHSVLSVQAEVVGELMDAAPGLSDVARRFTQEVIMINRKRLLDAP